MSRFRSRRTKLNTEFFSNWNYIRCYWEDFDYTVLNDRIMTRKRKGRSDSIPYNDVIIMADTETSKSQDSVQEPISPDYFLLKDLVDTTISISKEDAANIPDYKKWVKKSGLKITKDGIKIDSIWCEWCYQYPWLFPEDITHPADMLCYLSELWLKNKPDDYEALENHVCLWTISLRAYGYNITTLYGTKPTELIKCLTKIHNSLPGERTIIYWHNLSYDWFFIRQYCFEGWGEPSKLLATKPHYPIWIKFDNEIHFKDSLILFQRSLEKASADFGVEHCKAVGYWDYDIIRNQDYIYSENELHYAEYDTLAGVECLDIFMQSINKDITSIPYTSTGIIRGITRDEGKKHNAHEQFMRIAIDNIELLQKAIVTYHGGYVHANRYVIEMLLKKQMFNDLIWCLDFASSYPFCLCAFLYPMEQYEHLNNIYMADDIIRWYKADYSVIFTCTVTELELKNIRFPMPCVQQYGERVKEVVNGVFDNGRILEAESLTIQITEVDFILMSRYYKFKTCTCFDCYIAKKAYLPRWFTDLVFDLYKQKCALKHGDKVAYDISKTRVNGMYGLCCQKPIPDDIKENYQTGEYYIDEISKSDLQDKYAKYLKKINSILPYQWGMYVTNYAMLNLFTLGECAGQWFYSDTDSCYGTNWDWDKVNKYNEDALNKLRANGYDIITINGEEFQLGKAEIDYKGGYSEFITMGSKRYACRKADTNEIKITVAGVPKTGAKCLHDDLRNFKKGMIFDGLTTGKKTHAFIYNKMHIDSYGNEVADSIDLSPCDYKLDAIESYDWIFDDVLGSFEIECLDDGVII